MSSSSERKSEKDSSLATLLAGFVVELFCQGNIASLLDVDSSIPELEDVDPYAASPEFSLESVQSIQESVA